MAGPLCNLRRGPPRAPAPAGPVSNRLGESPGVRAAAKPRACSSPVVVIKHRQGIAVYVSPTF